MRSWESRPWGQLFFFFFFNGEFYEVSSATRNSDAEAVAGVCWKTKLKVTSYLPTAKSEKAIEGKAGKDIVCSVIKDISDQQYLCYLLKFWPALCNYFSRLSFISDAN